MSNSLMGPTPDNNTALINKKKNNTNSLQSNYANFFASLFYQIIVILIIIIFGTICLYKCKVAQSNLLPDASSCEPFTYRPIKISEIIADVNVIKSSKNGYMSTKITFPVTKNKEYINSAFSFIRTLKNGIDSNPFKLYFADLLENMISFDFIIKNKMYNVINLFPESIIIIFGHFFNILVIIVSIFCNYWYMIYLWFANIKLLFSEKSVNSNNKTTWKDGDMWDIMNWGWSFFYIWMFCIMFWVLGFWFIIPIVVLFITIICYFFPFFIKAYYKDKPDKQYSFTKMFKNIIKFKLNIIVFIVSALIVFDAYNSLGGTYAFSSFILFGFLYFFYAIYNTYNPSPSDYLSIGIDNYDQAIKTCI